MTPKISDTCMFMTTAKDIQDEIHQTYLETLDVAQMYEIKVMTRAAKQGNKTVTKYTDILKNLWQELDHYRRIEIKSFEGATI